MPYSIRFSTGFIAAICLSTAAFAAPPEAEDNSQVLIEKIEEKLSDHSVDLAKSTARLKRKMEKAKSSTEGNIGDELDVMADVLEEAFSKDGVFRDLAALVTDVAKDIDVDTNGGKTTLSFDGARVAQIQHSSSRDSEDNISISGLGKSFSMDRKTVVENGKSKTRIIIDLNGDDELDITLPSLDEK